MKKFLSALTLALCLFATVACSSKIGAVKKAFVNDGYQWEQVELEANKEGSETTKSVVKGIYLATKGITGMNIVVELKSTDDINKAVAALKEDPNLDGNEILKHILAAYNKSPLTYGNCILITLIDKNAVEIFEKLNGK